MLIAAAVVLIATAVVFVSSLSWLLKYRWRVDGESVRAIDRNDDALSESDRAFLDACHAEATAKGEAHIVDFLIVESGLRKVGNLTRIPETPFAVYRYRYIPTQRRLFGLRDSIEVENCAGRDTHRSVTNDQLALKDHTGHSASTIVLPRNLGLNALCAVAWAVAARDALDMCATDPVATGDTAIQRLIDRRAKVNLEMLNSGKVVELASGDYGFSRKTCVRLAAWTCPPMPYISSLVRRTRRDKLMRSLRPLLPDDLEADWIIPAVQDRVRTGSAAPLTQP